jgi:hypothetical protein
MNQKELIEHLKAEVKRVKIQRNEYEQRWFQSIREIEELKKIHNLPSYVKIYKEHFKLLKGKCA